MFHIRLLLTLCCFLGFQLPVCADGLLQPTWIFSPGIHGWLDQYCKYVNGGIVNVKINDKQHSIKTSRTLNVIDPHRGSCVCYAEVVVGHKAFFNPLSYLYNHILTNQVLYRNKGKLVTCEGLSCSFNLKRVNFGQLRDIKKLQETFKHHVKRFKPHEPIILFGASRGAACLFNACALKALPLEKIKGVILEGCFASVEEVVSSGKLSLNNYFTAFVRSAFHSIFRGYDAHGPKPINLVKQYPKDLPTFFITSYHDKLVSIDSTLKLFNALKSLGHTKVYLLVLNKAPHHEYMLHDDEREIYRKAVHAFYKVCNVAHDEVLAREGMKYLQTHL